MVNTGEIVNGPFNSTVPAQSFFIHINSCPVYHIENSHIQILLLNLNSYNVTLLKTAKIKLI
jgi:hypothetical protein